ncbi:MAG: BMP family ABC transporter substrate-binding protein [Acidimicrobiia bacterium]|nr:BMP family ABC transporter substrate-binding protein [Acidimicrobiia bacterium]
MRIRKSLIVLVALATLVAMIGVAPAGANHGANGKICIVNDIGGVNPFNASAAAGAAEAEKKLHVDVDILDADTPADITANIDQFVSDGDCDLIFGVAFIVAVAMEPFVIANPDQAFVVLDFTTGGIYPNVAEVVFEVDEAAFLAGYIAAGVSETGKVGVFGGLPIPPVTAFMDGYALGVEWYNSVYGADVEVLGWDPDLQSGLFSFTFTDPAAGQAIASALYDQGADSVFPVAGPTGFGVIDEASLRTANGEEVRVVGVDTDWSADFGDPDRVILTSVIKDLGPAVFNQAAAWVDGTWTGGVVHEGLAEESADIARFRKLNRVVPGFLKNDLKELRSGIIDGSIPTSP